MPLIYTSELEAVTNDYFIMQGKEAADIYFQTSYAINYFLKQQKGLWERPDGGSYFRVPLEYDEGIAGAYAKGDSVSSDMKETVQAARFTAKHYYGNASIYRIDQLENNGAYAQVQLITQKVSNCQKTLTKKASKDFYNDAGGDSKEFDGVLAIANTSAVISYGGLLSTDLVSTDGTQVWLGRRTTAATVLTLNMIRTMRTTAKVRDGANGRIDLVLTTPTLHDKIADILQLQQRYTESKNAVDAGFVGIRFEGCDIVEDDFCPSGYVVGLNSSYVGFGVHPDGYFSRNKWSVIPDSPDDKTMKIYLDANIICNNRRAHNAYTSVS